MKRRRIRSLLLVLAALSLPAAAKAGDVAAWSDTAGWRIQVDRPSKGCAMRRTFSRGTTILVMWNTQTRSFMFAFSNPGWTTVREGSQHRITMVMDGDKWGGTFTGSFAPDGTPFVMLASVKTDFLRALMAYNKIDFYSTENANWITGMTLQGSTAAMNELIVCQKTMLGEET